jgi:hypothetical protein
MNHPNAKLKRIAIPLAAAIAILSLWAVPSAASAQQEAPTPTALPVRDMFITVTTSEPQINVRAGPSSAVYPIVGTLLNGATVPALGRSGGGDWIQIEFAGAPNNKAWVYSPLVTVSPGVLPIAEPPPTPIPPPTATIDPTLAAQFNIAPTPARLATFTPPPSLSVPVYTESPDADRKLPIGPGMLILVLGAVSVASLLLSFLGRR